MSENLSIGDLVSKVNQWVIYLQKKWIVILICGVLGAALGLTYAFLKKPIYTATETFVLEEKGAGIGALGQYAGLASMAGIDIGGGGGLFEGDNIIELYKSRSMIQKTLLSTVSISNKSDLLINRFIDYNNLKEKWAEKISPSDIVYQSKKALTRLQDSVMGVIVKDINEEYLDVSKPDKKLSIIKVEVKAKDQIFAKLFIEQIVANVNKFYVETKTKKSIENINILQHQTDSVKSVMNGAIYLSASTVDATPNLNPSRQILRAPVQRSQFTAEMNKAILGELVKNLELSKISLRKETPLIQVIDVPVLPLEKEKVSKVKGLVLGGLLAGFLAIIVILIRGLFNNFKL